MLEVVLYALEMLDGMRRVLLCIREVLGRMRSVLLCILEVVEGELCLLEVLDVLEAMKVLGGNALCAVLYTGGCGGCVLFAGGVGGNAQCATLYAGGGGR